MFDGPLKDILKEREVVRVKVKVSDYIFVTNEEGKDKVKMVYSFNHLGQDFKFEGKKLYSTHIRKFVGKSHTLYVRFKDEMEVYESIRDSCTKIHAPLLINSTVMLFLMLCIFFYYLLA